MRSWLHTGRAALSSCLRCVDVCSFETAQAQACMGVHVLAGGVGRRSHGRWAEGWEGWARLGLGELSARRSRIPSTMRASTANVLPCQCATRMSLLQLHSCAPLVVDVVVAAGLAPDDVARGEGLNENERGVDETLGSRGCSTAGVVAFMVSR